MTPRSLSRWIPGLAAAACASLLLGAPPDLPENALPAKKIVKQVQVIVSGTAVDPNRIRANMSTREGGPFSDEMIDRDIKNLAATGLVDKLDIKTEDVPGGVKVIVMVTGRGSIGSIVFVGNRSVDESSLREAVDVKVGQPVDEAKLAAGASKIRETYTKKGYADLDVTFKTQEMADKKGFVQVSYIITEGARSIINDIRFEGLTALKPSEVRGKMKLKVKHFYHLWGKAGKLDNEALREDISTVQRAIQDKGYVYAKVLQVRREPVKADRVNLVFVIDEGRRYAVSDVALEGNKVFATQELAPALRSAAGKAYSVSNTTTDEKTIADYYGSRGYADASVETSIVQAGADSVKILYRISEGEKSQVRMINITGNEKTKDKVIRREIKVAPGDDFNTVRIEKSANALRQMGYFSQVDIRRTPTSTPGYKDLEVNVKEQSTGFINLGAGFSSIDSLSGFFDVTETNFDIGHWPPKGGGQRFNVHVQAGLKTQDYEIGLTEPWFLGQRLSLGGLLFFRDLRYLSPNDLYDQREYGGAITLRKPIGDNAYAQLRYTAQDVEIHNIDQKKASDLIKAEAGKKTESKLDLSLTHETIDSVVMPRKGHHIELGGTYSGLGGDVKFTGLHANAVQFVPLPGDIIFSIEGKAQTVHGQSGQKVPIFERLFLGGANDLRGFKFRDAGPKDVNGEPIGGTTAYNGTAELNFPILGERDEPKLRGAVFYDVGKVTGGPGTFGGGTYSDVGVGLRIFLLPGAPIRIDVGFPTQHDTFTGSGARFNFQLGYRF